MPHLAASTWKAPRKYLCAATAVVILTAVIVVGNPFAGQAKATTIPIVFPLEIRVKFSDTYGAPRAGHTHQGNDLMCPKMTKELAAVAGTVKLMTSTYNGQPSYSLWISGDDGHGYFYIHINNDTPGTDDGNGGLANAFAPGLKTGDHVAQGQFISYAGDSGNAENVGSHLHFEIHTTTSMSSPSIDPYDSLMAAPMAGGTPPPSPGPIVTRYEQSNANITYLGKWTTFTTSGASGGSYKYADGPAKAVIWFTGTNLALIATKGTTQGKAAVTLDGVSKGLIDLSSTTTLRKQKAWSTGTLATGLHKVEISWTGQKGVSGGTRVNVDAVDVIGKLSPVKLTTIEQTASNFVYQPKWTTIYGSAYSGGSTNYINSAGSSVTIRFTGSYMVWLAKTASVYGIARVRLDGGPARYVDLYTATTKYKQRVWNTGPLTYGAHTVLIQWTGTKNAASTKTNIGIDAIQVLGPSS